MDVLCKRSAGGQITTGGNLQSEITKSYYTALSELDQRLWKLVVIVSNDERGRFVKTEAYYVIDLSMAHLLQVVLSNIQKVPFYKRGFFLWTLLPPANEV